MARNLAPGRTGARRTHHQISSWGSPWAEARAAGKTVPMQETAGVGFRGHGAGQRRMERRLGCRGRQREETHQARSDLEAVVMIWERDTERLNQGSCREKCSVGDRCRGV